MRTLTAAADDARTRSHATPLLLLKIEFTDPTSFTLRVSDRAVSALGFDWHPLVQKWGDMQSALEDIKTSFRPSTLDVVLFNSVKVEASLGVVKDRVSDLIRTHSNTDEAYEWSSAKATLYYLVDERLGSGDEVTLGVFYLEDPVDIGEDVLTVRMSDVSLFLETKAKLTTITRDLFPACDKSLIGQKVPVVLGTVKNVPCKWVKGGATTTLNEALDDSETTITLTDASAFASSGSVIIGAEIISYTGKSGNDITGCTRGTQTTAAGEHANGTKVYEILGSYIAVVGENLGDFKISAISNIKVNGIPAATAPTTSVDDATLVSGKSFARVTFTPSNVKRFHLAGSGTFVVEPASLPSNNWTGASGALQLNIDVTYPTQDWEARVTSVGITTRVTANTGAGTYTDIGINRWDQERNTYVSITGQRTPTDFTNLYDERPQDFSWTRGVYNWGLSSGVNDVVGVAVTAASGLTVTFTMNDYDIQVNTEVSASGSGGSASTAAYCVGDVTCDVTGILDDGSGTISGSASLLLENPVDQFKLVASQLYPNVSLATDFGDTFAGTRARLQDAGVVWSHVLDDLSLNAFMAATGEQARSVVYVDSGKFEMKYLADDPVSDIEIDYEREVYKDAPARLERTPRAEVYNSWVVESDYDPGADQYGRTETYEDLTQIGFTDRTQSTLRLDRVRDGAAARVVSLYQLAWRKRPRIIVRLETFWNAIALQIGDHFTVVGHPLLARHGGDELVFRVVSLRRTLGAGRLEIAGVEARLPADWWGWWQTRPSPVPTWKVALGL